jgi:hypothetical protein
MERSAPAFDIQCASQLVKLRTSGRFEGIVDGWYVSDILGIGFRLPDGWIVRSLKEVADTKEGRMLRNDLPEWNEALRQVSDQHLPLVTISAPTWDDPRARLGPHELSPVVVLQLEHVIEDEASSMFNFEAHVEEDVANFRALIAEYRLLSGPTLTTAFGPPAIEFVAAYTMLHADAVEGCPTRERALYVHHGSAVYAIRLCDYPERHEKLAFDFDPFLETILFRATA